MKTETQIAQENVELYKKNVIEPCERNSKALRKAVCVNHKATCQRFLEFLEEHKIEIGLAYGDSATVSQSPDWLKHKMIDIENTIKLYNEVGISNGR